LVVSGLVIELVSVQNRKCNRSKETEHVGDKNRNVGVGGESPGVGGTDRKGKGEGIGVGDESRTIANLQRMGLEIGGNVNLFLGMDDGYSDRL